MKCDYCGRSANRGSAFQDGGFVCYDCTPDPDINVTSFDPNQSAEAIRLADFMEEPPRRWIVADHVPEGVLTCYYGAGGLGKSYWLLYEQLCVSIGCPVLNTYTTLQMPTLYVDGELDWKEYNRRAYALMRGMGRSTLPNNAFYYHLEGPLTSDLVRTALSKAIADIKSEYGMAPIIFIDSLSVVLSGGSLVEGSPVIQALKAMETFGTVVTLDHIARVQKGGNQSEQGQYGSVFKQNLCRSQIQFVKATDEDVTGVHARMTKANFGRFAQPFNFVIEHLGTKDQPAVRIEAVTVTDPRMGNVASELRAKDNILMYLQGEPDGGTTKDIAEALGLEPGTVGNSLTKLKNVGKVRKMGGKWRAVV